MKTIAIFTAVASLFLAACDKDHAGRRANNDGQDNAKAPSGGASGPEKTSPPEKK